MQRQLVRIMLYAPALCLLISAARADEAGAVGSSGTAKLETAPTLMRVKLEISAKGANVREALAALKDLRDVARDKVQKLGAKTDSIHFSDPTIGKGANPQGQMQAMIQQRLRSQRNKKTAPAKTVSVSTSLAAEWPLAAGTPEAVLIAAGELREKIKAADLAGTKDSKAKSAEEEELAEEAAMISQQPVFMSDGSDAQPAVPGAPSFVFVAQITGQQRSKLLAEAFERARQEASQLAEAAGAQLGALRQLSANPAADGNPYAQAWAAYGMMQDPSAAEHGPLEAVGAEPSGLVYKVMLTASFNLKP